LAIENNIPGENTASKRRVLEVDGVDLGALEVIYRAVNIWPGANRAQRSKTGWELCYPVIKVGFQCRGRAEGICFAVHGSVAHRGACVGSAAGKQLKRRRADPWGALCSEGAKLNLIGLPGATASSAMIRYRRR